MKPEENNLSWKKPYTEGHFSIDEICEDIRQKRLVPATEWEIGVGTDSQIRGSNVHFTTVICLYQKTKGGTYYYANSLVSKKNLGMGNNQVLRMYEEVRRALEIAMKIEEIAGIKPLVHVDASKPHRKVFTSSISEQLKGYVVSSGYECVLKPDSYIASCIADRHSKKS